MQQEGCKQGKAKESCSRLACRIPSHSCLLPKARVSHPFSLLLTTQGSRVASLLTTAYCSRLACRIPSTTAYCSRLTCRIPSACRSYLSLTSTALARRAPWSQTCPSPAPCSRPTHDGAESGETKVRQPRLPSLDEEDVGRLQVAVLYKITPSS